MKIKIQLSRLVTMDEGGALIVEQEPDENLAPGNYVVLRDQELEVEVDLELSEAYIDEVRGRLTALMTTRPQA